MAQSTIKLGQRFNDYGKAISDNFVDLYINKADKAALTSHNTASFTAQINLRAISS